MKTASILKLSDLGNDSSKIIKNDIKNKDENISFESALSVFDLLLYIITGEELESNDVNNQNHGKVNLEEGKDLGVDLNFFRSIMSNIDNGEIQVLAKLLADDGYVIQNKFIQAFENELIEQDGGDAIKIEELLERIETDTDHIPSSDFVVDKQQKSIDVASRMLEFSQVLQNTDDSRVNREVKFTANTDTQRLEGQAKSEKIELPTSKSYNEESDLNVKIEQNRQNKAKPYEINNEDYGTLKKDEYNENHVQTKKDLIDIISQKQNDKFNNNLVIQDTSIYTPLGKMGNILQGNTSINSYLVNQISEKIEFLVKGKDTQEAIIQLKPPSLGKINIQVTFERGVLTARIVTQNQEVKNIIESNLPLLKQNLADQGMGISNLSVSVNTGDSKGFEYYKDKRQTKTNLKRPNIKDVSGNSSAIKKYDDYLNIGYINYLV